MFGVLQGFQKRNEGRKVRSARYCGLSGRRFEYETIARSPKEGDVRVCFKAFWLMLVDVAGAQRASELAVQTCAACVDYDPADEAAEEMLVQLARRTSG
jgi:hypothetical protein